MGVGIVWSSNAVIFKQFFEFGFAGNYMNYMACS